MSVVISVENVGKKYRIRHQQGGPVYVALRDVIADKVKGAFHKLRGGLGSKQVLTESERAGGNSVPSHEDFWALKEISFELRQGEVIGIIGRNGAGKSTLLKILSRITEPTNGRVRIRGRLASLLEVGTGFHPELTGRENVFLNGAILGMSRAEIKAKFDDIVAFAEVEKFLDTPVKRYSSGMYVRLAFAVAAHLEPEILVVDEVLAVGDSGFQKKCLGKMGEVAREGRTILFVSHNMQAICAMCSRAILLQNGSLCSSGHPQDVIADYLGDNSSDYGKSQTHIWTDRATAPGNDQIRLRRLAIIPGSDGADQLLDRTTSFTIEVEYWNLSPRLTVIVELVFCLPDGSPVFETLTEHEPNWHGRPFPAGLFISRCRIPGNFLNEGNYRIRLLFADDKPAILYDDHDALTITVHDVAERKIAWFGRYLGTVHPKLDWETHIVSEGL